MSEPVQADDPTDHTTNKHPHLGLQEHIQCGIILATQLCCAASKDHLDSKEWTANQAAANEFLRTFENMQEKTVKRVYCTSDSIEGLIATQVKLEVKMDKLQERCYDQKLYPRLHSEIKFYLAPSQSDSRERMVNIALEKMEGVSCTDLSARVSEAVESAILEEFHKGIDKQMRGYME